MAYTAYDESVLKSRNFLTDYANNKEQFVEVGKLVYRTLLTHGGNSPSQTDMERPLGIALQSANIFKAICGGKLHAPPMFYPTFAFALARYIIATAWSDIINP
jgi:hypothetical protein